MRRARRENHAFKGGLAKYYKVLTEKGQGPFSMATFSLPYLHTIYPSRVIAGQWHTVVGELQQCQNGLHVTTPKSIFSWYRRGRGYRVFAVGLPPQVERARTNDRTKAVFRTIRLTREVMPGSPEWLLLGLPNAQ
jgi:hypothetical protein